MKLGRITLIILFLSLFSPWNVLGQGATAGYTKVGSVAFGTNTYTDTTPVTGQVTSYEVTSVNAAGESGPSNIVSATTPSTTVAHSNKLTWTAPASGGTPTSYNVYSLAVVPANPPAGLTVLTQ